MEQKEKINLEEIEKELGKQLLPNDFYFAVILEPEIKILQSILLDGEEEGEDESSTSYIVWLAEKKVWDKNRTLLESPMHENTVDAHSYIIQLIEDTEKIEHLFGTSFTTFEDVYESIEEVKADMESLGFTYLPELEEAMNKELEEDDEDVDLEHNEIFNKLLKPGDKELYEKIVDVFEKCKEEKLKTEFKGKENYATDVAIPEDVIKALDSTFTPEELYKRWDIEEGEHLCNIEIYAWQGKLYVEVDGCFDCDLLTFPVDGIKLLLDHLSTYTPETLPLKIATA